MPDTASKSARPIRDAADAYVGALAELDPLLATRLGLKSGQDLLPDLSPAGHQASDELDRATLATLAALTQASAPAGETGDAAADERRCARLLRERLTAGLAKSEADEHLRNVSNIFGPMPQIRSSFVIMPTASHDDWATVARRLGRVPEALAGYRASLAEGTRRGLLAAPRQVRTMMGQLAQWQAAGDGRGWYAEFAAGAGAPAPLQADLDKAAAAATAAHAELRDWLGASYLPRTGGVPDGVGDERYRVTARYWSGADIDPLDAYAWGWSEYLSLREQMATEAGRVLPGASAGEAMAHLNQHGEIIDGPEQIRRWLQDRMDEAIADLSGTHFDLADRVKAVEARLAPAGTAAAPYYTPPSQDFTRPGRTWLPTLGETRFPVWHLVSTWYHEGVPGHHLQYGQWTHLAEQLSVYQTSVGTVSACTEGWALYAERLMDELGYLARPGARLGYLDAQLLRAIRVVIDIGMHLELRVPADSPMAPGEVWLPELAGDFFNAHTGRGRAFVDSEIVRYLGAPGQAITYKLGERAWLAGRGAAQAHQGSAFDLKSWHMAALSLGSLGLDDLATELAAA
ncbi:MAG TPA: DUF885 domain-containing protein [Streptosporangiaceae bacterium]